jgi:hypothetical protein
MIKTRHGGTVGGRLNGFWVARLYSTVFSGHCRAIGKRQCWLGLVPIWDIVALLVMAEIELIFGWRCQKADR